MANRTLTQIASLFQDFDRQIKDFEAILTNAQQSSRQLRVSLRDIIVQVKEDYQDLR